jgi:hypothetical protein
MFHSIYSQLSFVALFGCCGLAFWKGGPAERGGAILICGTWLAAMLGLAVERQYVLAIPFLLSDAVLAIGLLILAIRYSNWWMGAAMLLQAIGLSFHAAYFAADQSEISKKALHFYVMGKNLSSWGMLLVILIGTLAAWRKRTRGEARARAPDAVSLPTGAAPG